MAYFYNEASLVIEPLKNWDTRPVLQSFLYFCVSFVRFCDAAHGL